MQYAFIGSPSMDTAIAAAIAVAAALAVHGIAVGVLRRMLRARPFASALLGKASTPARWALVFAATSAVLEGAPAELAWRATLAHAATLGLIACATWLAARLIDAGVDVVMALNPADVADNLHARARRTQARVLGRTVKVLAFTFGMAAALITFPGVRQLGATLLASAGVVGLVAGLAARPVLSNLMAGLQIALTQPIRIDDVLIVSGEWGRVEEISGAYVVLKIWDERRMVVPLNWFIENPFQNWTRTSSQILGSVFLWLDYSAPVEEVRAEFLRLCRDAPEWDGRVASLQVTEANERAMQLRGIASAADAGKAWDLRCKLREGLIDFVRRRCPQHLPRLRVEAEPAASAQQ
jgi:small-conductance mechanosensitive channel